ncbi:helix-turn-helix domain-containing protein [Bacteroides sp.]|uniref:helix-turn-helix domain-containing protein n=1 Tax=Bacteroides sp. TaxID=29523 RepID=UPI00260D8DD7|nr:helix-turn-helix domain-containing protein [Bacteroides sp.]MDD3039138.1 helix-turn-helix domain-containing protein [Bacteroides sp.]
MAKRYIAFMWWLSSISIIIALTIGKFSGEKIEILNIYSITNFPIGCFLGMYSFLYLCNARKSFRQRLIWSFSLPFFLVLLHHIMVASQGNLQIYSMQQYVNTIADSPILIIRTAILGTTVVCVLISVAQCFKARRIYEKVLEDFFRNNELKYSGWMSKMFYSIIPILFFVTLSYVVNSIYYNFVYDIMLIFIVIFYTMKVINYQYLLHTIQSVTESLETKQEKPIENEFEVIEKGRQEKSNKSSADDAIKEQSQQRVIRSENKYRMIHESIEKWINDEEKAYLKNGLTIQEVSLMTGIPKRKLADFIHLHYNLSFNSWINTLRVQEVERILSNKESSTMTLSEIAYKTGFSDLSNMSSTFKKIKRMNPSEYRILVNQ